MTRWLCALLALLAAAPLHAADAPTIYRVETVAGSSLNGDGGPAILAQIGAIQGITADRWGNVYLSDTDNHRVRKVDANGGIVTVAGTGTAGFGGDGGPAIAAQLNLPYGLAVDASGNLYVADLGNSRIRRIAPDGAISTYAGGGSPAADGDGGAAVSACLRTPRNLAVDAAGNLYVSEFQGQRVRKITPDGRIATAAGTGTAGFSGDGGPASHAQLAFPAGLALDRAGNLYIADSQNQRIRRIWSDGSIATIAGPGSPVLATPTAVAVDTAGALYIADGSGSIKYCAASHACSSLAASSSPNDLALDAAGSLYVADGAFIRKLDPRGVVQTIAGDGYVHAVGDGGPATSAQLLQPAAVALDIGGNLYIADTATQRVRQVLPSGIIQTLAGSSDVHAPSGVAVNAAGEVLIADTGNHRIRKSAGGAVSTIAGTGTAGNGSEGLAPLLTALNGPRGVCLDPAGSVYIVDTGNHRVLRLATGGVVAIAAGNGAPGSAGDGGAARLAQLNQPSSCTIDAAGNLFIADTANHRIRKVAAGVITTIAGTGQASAGGDEGQASAAGLNAPRGVAADSQGNLFIGDTGNNLIRMVTADGVIHTVAGPPDLQAPEGLALDGSGDLYVADTGNNRTRRLVPVSSMLVAAPLLSIVNAASQASGPVSPGEIVGIFGVGIGPGKGVSATFDSTGSLPTQLGGAEVRFDGIPAPLFYAQAGQVNAQVPYNVTAATTHIQVLWQGQPVSSADVPVSSASPGLFPSPNTEDNPAPRGSVVVFYATGEGFTTGPDVAGQAAIAPYPQPALPVTLTVAGVTAQLLYAGSAPGAAGVLQVNAVIPGGFLAAGPADVRLSVGSALSPPLTIWLQ